MPNKQDKSKLKQSSSSPTKKRMSNYNKRLILNTLKEINCNPNQIDVVLGRFRIIGEDDIKEYTDSQAEMSQSRLEQNMRAQNNRHFMNLDQCAKNLTEDSDSTVSDNTLPVAFEAIANLEQFPPAAELNGIDLKALYRMLANMSAGYQVDELEDGPTKDFLHQCYSEMMENVSEMSSKSFKAILSENDKQTQLVYSWLCNTDYSQYLSKIFNEPNDS